VLSPVRLPGARIAVGGDAMTVDGERMPYVRQARELAASVALAASRAAGFDVRVRAVLAVCRAATPWSISVQPADGMVTVIAPGELLPLLGAQGRILERREIDRIASGLCRPPVAAATLRAI
jgi:hypothetical protein